MSGSGGGVRVGLDDNIDCDFGRERLAVNLELVHRVVRIAAEFSINWK